MQDTKSNLESWEKIKLRTDCRILIGVETTLKLLHQLNLHKHLIRVVPFTHWVPSATMSLLQSTAGIWNGVRLWLLYVQNTDLLIQMLFWWKSSFIFQGNLQNFERLSRHAPPGVVGAFLDIFPFIYLFD